MAKKTACDDPKRSKSGESEPKQWADIPTSEPFQIQSVMCYIVNIKILITAALMIVLPFFSDQLLTVKYI